MNILYVLLTVVHGAVFYLQPPEVSVTLRSDNSVILRGEVNKETATRFMSDLQDTQSNPVYVFLDTPGGSVTYGSKIVTEIMSRNVTCIAERAYSMGFVIFQACTNRYMMKHGSVMQHQISYSIGGEQYKIDSYAEYVRQIEAEMVELQAQRIGISTDVFRKKTMNEWWLYGRNAILERCADHIVNLKCNRVLRTTNFTVTEGSYKLVYSRCPLVPGELSKERDKSKKEQITIFPFYTEEYMQPELIL